MQTVSTLPKWVLTRDSGEEKPSCVNCQRQGETCDYSIRLNWDGRSKKKDDGKPGSQLLSFDAPLSTAENTIRSPSEGAPSGSPATQNPFQTTELNYVRQPSPYSIPPDQPLPPIADFASNLPLSATDFGTPALPAPPILRNPQWHEPSGA